MKKYNTPIIELCGMSALDIITSSFEEVESSAGDVYSWRQYAVDMQSGL